MSLVLSSRLALGALALVAATQVLATPVFFPSFQQREVQISARLQVDDHETDESHRHEDHRGDRAPKDHFGPVSLTSGVGFSDNAGAIFAQGASTQQSSVTASRISFSGLADINVSGFSGYPLYVSGDGASASVFELKFTVPKTVTVALAMNSEVQRFRDNDWRFLLARADGTPVWDATVVYGDDGLEHRSFVQQLELTAGDYFIQASVRAHSWWNGDAGFAGRTSAQFSISPVPEPATAVMALLGLGLLAAQRSRRARA